MRAALGAARGSFLGSRAFSDFIGQDRQLSGPRSRRGFRRSDLLEPRLAVAQSGRIEAPKQVRGELE
eukprot:CAMPEP_0115156436 /NCGR_PEP_ID=MMETSP0227-20121206/68438_1 /TAXON_ID=89957 /ORGANISM="Polarella glacialis, Strain CCMP 1383" /LENGTH=66 /DNA_ID=CAMNT_0002567601 /DNA_START=413 /DNA_END=610 /DNA_ORIENTATION=+